MEIPSRILTVPEEVTEQGAFECTGNEYVSLPEIRRTDGGVASLNSILLSARGLVEFSGGREPLMVPFFKVDGSEGSGPATWARAGEWIPSFSFNAGAVTLRGTIVAPVGFKGFVYILEAVNRGPRCDVEWGISGHWSGCAHIIFTRKPIRAERNVRYSKWTRGLILEARAGLPLMAAAVSASEPLDEVLVAAGEDALAPIGAGELDVSDDRAVRFKLGRHVTMETGARAALAFYVSINLEGDGAGTGGVDLARHGYESLLECTESWLARHWIGHSDPRLEAVLNRNLVFCHFFAFGRSLDGEALVPVTSRSPRYYVSAAFWARDALLWAFPALMMIDPMQARELLILVFTRYLKNAGIHALYIDGTVLYPGFELDELAAYTVALEGYLDQTGDMGIMEEPDVQKGLIYLEDRLWERRDARMDLFSTFLHPSDDPVVYPYLTYDNALAWRMLRFLAANHERLGRFESALRCRAAAENLVRCVREHLVVDGPFGPMFGWSADLEGRHLLYDDAPGGLQLLAHYGFCALDDPIYQNTIQWAYSCHNLFFYEDGAFNENGCEHARHPWLLHVANSLLGARPNEGEDFLRRAEMDQGLVCETVDRYSGRVKTGAAFATCAGFVAYALHRADQRKREGG